MPVLDKLSKNSDKIISLIFIFNSLKATLEWLSTSTMTTITEIILSSIMWIGCYIFVLFVYYAFLIENNRRFKKLDISNNISDDKLKCDILLSFTCSIGLEITIQLMAFLPIMNNLPIYLCMLVLLVTMYLMSKVLNYYKPKKGNNK